MHPPLYRPHPDCQDVIAKLVSCHEENKFSKYFGACNEAKLALDLCFKAEKERKRQANSEAAKKQEREMIKAIAKEAAIARELKNYLKELNKEDK